MTASGAAGLIAAISGFLALAGAGVRTLVRVARALERAGELLRVLSHIAADHEDRITSMEGERGTWGSGTGSPGGPRIAAGGSRPPQR